MSLKFKTTVAFILILFAVFTANRFNDFAFSKTLREGFASAYLALSGEPFYKADDLNSKIQKLKLGNKRLEFENRALKSFISALESRPIFAKENNSYEPAYKIPTPGSNFYGSLMLKFSKKATKKIKPGAIVLDRFGFAIGKVESVSSGQALVSLFSSPEKKVRVNVSGLQAVGKGKSNGAFLIELPSITSKDFQGGLVFLQDLSIYPIAEVVKQEKANASNVFSVFYAKTPNGIWGENIFFIDTSEYEE